MDYNMNTLDNLPNAQIDRNRKDLLPNWIKAFIWVFLILGATALTGSLTYTQNIDFHLALYGIETYQPFSIIGITLLFLIALKFVVALGLLTEQNWAVDLAIIDGLLGVIIVLFIMLVLPFMEEIDTISPSIRLELIPLTFYLIKMYQIKPDWDLLKP